MSEYIEIQNFGSIKEAKVDIKPLTLLIGRQDSGKSTICKLIKICRNMQHLISVSDRPDIMQPFHRMHIAEYFDVDSYFHYSNTDSRIDLTYCNGTFSFENSKDAAYTNSEMEYGNNGRDTAYIPSERSSLACISSYLATIMLARVPLPDILLEYMSIFEKARKDKPEYDIPSLGLKCRIKDGELFVILDINGKVMPLSSCSSGMQSVIPIMMSTEYICKSAIYKNMIIEEMEQNLYPETQCNMLRFFLNKIYEHGLDNIILTTHSPYILSCLNNSILAARLSLDTAKKDNVKAVVPDRYQISKKDVAVYSMVADSCGRYRSKNIISNSTGLISVNELDCVSEKICDEYDRLYHFFLERVHGKS